ncbi:NAD-dependent epimerase/dehydratase family protein [Streptomyces sp. SID486]|uniref:SDR family oxidoreductase n=1 Tax=unclassified Streptomyces TaxID=2593676 RepID=UPI0013704C15|nr:MULTISPECIES: SDR family oxidoreductase [unclassified Streptomyces]MYW47161.1 NAD-dependent epimerase/dehydratase family protein [Streptomyces sp. SID161]MYX94153.1 NAD-dependent epimerase/dehydratase family protein [Streptomyces sp. SID486]
MRIFVTGASGWIGSALVPDLIEAGHHVLGLARSDASADALAGAGAEVVRGTIDDLDVLRDAAAASDGVVHLAFKHEEAFGGDFQGAGEADRRAVDAIGDALAGTGRPFVLASGLAGLTPGRVATERDRPATGGSPVAIRAVTAEAVLALASRGVRSSVVRLSPTCHGDGDNGFMAALVAIAREKGVSGYVGDGANRWPAVHRLDAARLFRLAAEKAPAGSVLHGVAEEGVTIRDVAEVIGRHLGVPVASVAAEAAAGHFGWLGGFIALDVAASSTLTRELLGWAPAGPGLLADLDKGHYFHGPAATG